jgi:hypothetical protein
LPYSLLADFVVLLHLGFVLFVARGGLLVLKWPRLAWLHLPAAAWGAAIEFGGWLCPLTYLEVWLRGPGSHLGDRSDFASRFLLPILYPPELTRTVRIALGLLDIVINLIICWQVRKEHTPCRPDADPQADL